MQARPKRDLHEIFSNDREQVNLCKMGLLLAVEQYNTSLPKREELISKL